MSVNENVNVDTITVYTLSHVHNNDGGIYDIVTLLLLIITMINISIHFP